MFSQGWRYVLVPIFALVVACARLPETPPGGEPLAVDQLREQAAVPAEWGNLIAVNAVVAPWFQFWFQDQEGTIRLVLYNGTNRTLARQVRIIRRN